MALQPNLLAVNTLPPVFATRGRTPEPEVAREQTAATPVKPIVDGFFISPLLQFDNQALALIFQVRDTESGEVQRQFPRESVIESLRSNPEIRTIQIPSDGQDAVNNGGSEEPDAVEAVVGNGGSSESNAAENDTVVSVGGTEAANGAPAIGGTAVGVSPALGPGSQGVNLLV